jgi:hypothetical protein
MSPLEEGEGLRLRTAAAPTHGHISHYRIPGCLLLMRQATGPCCFGAEDE